MSIEHIYKAIQLAEMVNSDNPVLAELAASQATHESRLFGKPSDLATEGNNYFGVKAKAGEPYVEMWTTEYDKHKVPRRVKEKFRKYDNPEESFSHWRELMEKPLYGKIRNAGSTEDAITAMSQSVYATDPNYITGLRMSHKMVKSSKAEIEEAKAGLLGNQKNDFLSNGFSFSNSVKEFGFETLGIIQVTSLNNGETKFAYTGRE